RRFEVGLEDRVVEIARTDEATGVDVDRRQRFRLVDDQVATRLQLHAPRQRARDLFFDAEEIEDRPLAAVVLELRDRGRRVDAAKGLQRVELHLRIDADRLGL